MKWLHFDNVPMYINKDGKVRNSEPWVSVEEMMADSGKQKGIKLMGMTISVVKGFPVFEPQEVLWLHFIGQPPTRGIRVGYLADNEKGRRS